jgi:Phytanoyl-CoA dioxygenase (PhyH)
MLTDEQLRAFHDDGFVALPGAVAPDGIARMRERIWRRLERHGAVRDDPSTWRAEQTYGLRPVKKADPDPHDSPIFTGALDDVFGAGVWRTPSNWGQVLVTYPTAARWDVPHRPWHLDHRYDQPPDVIWGINVFLFVDVVEPRGGGTLVVRGSPRHVRRFTQAARPAVRTQKQWRTAFDASNPWFRALSDPHDRDARVERFLSETDVDGVPTQVVELTGEPGDVVVCHPWLVHNVGPNANAGPRMMRASRVHHVELLAIYGPKVAAEV